MLRTSVLFASLVVIVASVAVADPVATVEVFDDPAFTLRTGVMDGPMKTLYVRIQYHWEGYSGVELSFTGLHDFDSVTPNFPNEPALILGSLPAPEDQVSGSGGINIGWVTCQTNPLLLTMTLVSANPPENRAIQVARRFPPGNPFWPFPRHTYCDAPCFCTAEIGGAPYVLNPVVSTNSVTWSAVKQLYDRHP